jgi:hypothetical protein
MTTETEQSPGVTSSMRVTLKNARRAGFFMIFSGVALCIAMLILGRGYELVPVAILLETAGPGMITGLGYAKAMQSKNESE